MARIVIIAGLTLICAASDAEARYRNRVQQCIETGTELQPVLGDTGGICARGHLHGRDARACRVHGRDDVVE